MIIQDHLKDFWFFLMLSFSIQKILEMSCLFLPLQNLSEDLDVNS